jgi:ribosome biogenesis protein Nip4
MNDENLGFGKKINQGKKMFVKPILDRGNFLRRERK